MNDTNCSCARVEEVKQGHSKQQGDSRKAVNEDERENERVLSGAVPRWENLAEQLSKNAAWVGERQASKCDTTKTNKQTNEINQLDGCDAMAATESDEHNGRP